MAIKAVKQYCPSGTACVETYALSLSVDGNNHYFEGSNEIHSVASVFSYAETGALVVTVANNPALTPIYRNGRLTSSPDAAELEIVAPGTFKFKANALLSGQTVTWAIGGTWSACQGSGDGYVTQLQVTVKRESAFVSVGCD